MRIVTRYILSTLMSMYLSIFNKDSTVLSFLDFDKINTVSFTFGCECKENILD